MMTLIGFMLRSSPRLENMKNANRRKHIRFSPDPPCTALVLTDGKGKALKNPLPCVVVEESATGCGLVSAMNPLFVKDTILVVQVGQLSEMPSLIRWVKTFDDRICYFGLEYMV